MFEMGKVRRERAFAVQEIGIGESYDVSAA